MGISFDINESSTTKKIRSIRRLKDYGTGGERDAAGKALERLTGPQLPLVKRKDKFRNDPKTSANIA